jgi:hypothetical protein
MQAWGIAPGISLPPDNQALKARLKSASGFSIPNIPFVEIHAVLTEQLAVFLLKGPSAMMLLLHLDISHHGIKLILAH